MYFADLGQGVGYKQEGYRLVVVIQNNLGNKHSPTVIIVAISSRVGVKPTPPTYYYINAENGLELTAIILLEQVRTDDKRRLITYIGRLSEEHISGMDRALAASIDLIKPIHSKLTLCLCGACADVFAAQAFLIYGKPLYNRLKKLCAYCRQSLGATYEVTSQDCR